jgi:hypothetical protein
LQTTQAEIHQLTEQVNQQNNRIASKEFQIDSSVKEIHDLEHCLSTTHDELANQRTKVHESKAKVRSLTQKMHRLMADEKPLAKEISHCQKQVTQNEIQYNTIIAKLTIDSKQNDRILRQETLALQQCCNETERSKENTKKLNDDLKYSEDNYQNLKEIFHDTVNENRQLKQHYADLMFVVQSLGQKQAITTNELNPLYEKVKYLTKQHLDHGMHSIVKRMIFPSFLVTMIEQSKSDLNILHKYYLQLRSHNHQLHQSLSFKSQEHNEYLHSQSISNQFTNFQNQVEFEMKKTRNPIHYWHTFTISSPDKFDNILKLFLLKKKLVHKSNELLNLKKIFHEKDTLYQYLNRIYTRREKLVQKMNTYDVLLKDQMIQRKKKSIVNLRS